MQTRTDLGPVPLGVMACALAVRMSTDDGPRLNRRMQRIAAIAGMLPPALFEMELMRPLGPVTLSTVGRRTGRPHSVTLIASPLGDGLVATTCMGPDPDWIRNLHCSPRAEVVVGSATLPVEASFPRGHRRAEAAAALVDCRNPLVAALMRRLVRGGAASDPQIVVLSPC